MATRLRVAFLLVAFAATSAAVAEAQSDAFVYGVKHRRAEELLPLARTALGAVSGKMKSRSDGDVGTSGLISDAKDMVHVTVVLAKSGDDLTILTCYPVAAPQNKCKRDKDKVEYVGNPHIHPKDFPKEAAKAPNWD